MAELPHVERFLAAQRNVKPTGSATWQFSCPHAGHENGDRRPSASVTIAPPDDRLLVTCYAGHTAEDICAASGLALADLFPSRDPAPARSGNGKRRIVATYPYVDEDGVLLFEVVRFEPKDFRQRVPDGKGGWSWRLGETRRVLYRLPAIMAAAGAGKTVYVVEGEKDVHAVEQAGGIATCCSMGAGKWRPEYNDMLRLARVVVVADRDQPGREHAAAVAAALRGVARSVEVAEPVAGKDAADHLAAGHSLDDLVEVQLEEPPSVNDRYAGRILDVAALLAEPETPIPWRCEDLAADGFLTVLAGRGGEGKSWLALALACGVARGEPAAGLACTPGRAVIFDAENGPRLTIRRFRAAGVTAGLAVQPVDAGGLRCMNGDLDWFRQVIEDQKANLVVFDSLRVLSSGAAENESDALEPIITALKQLARDTGAAILLIHHRGKGEDSDFRGSSVILDQTDLMFRLERVKDDPESRRRRKIRTVKCRIDEEPEPRWVAIEADPDRGLVYVNEADPYDGDDDARERPRDAHRAEVLKLRAAGRSVREIAEDIGISKSSVQRILDDADASVPPSQALKGVGQLGHPENGAENGSSKPDSSVPGGGAADGPAGTVQRRLDGTAVGDGFSLADRLQGMADAAPYRLPRDDSNDDEERERYR